MFGEEEQSSTWIVVRSDSCMAKNLVCLKSDTQSLVAALLDRARVNLLLLDLDLDLDLGSSADMVDVGVGVQRESD